MNKGDIFELRYAVTPQVRDGFREIFKDANPLHTDRAFARELGFTEEVMYGNILNGFISHFIGEALPVKNVIIHSQQIKFFKPFYCGDKLLLKAEIGEAVESVNAFIFNFAFSNQHGQEIARGKVQIGVI
jgi:3-hydroxybutyryl-CoA dehydratase